MTKYPSITSAFGHPIKPYELIKAEFDKVSNYSQKLHLQTIILFFHLRSISGKAFALAFLVVGAVSVNPFFLGCTISTALLANAQCSLNPKDPTLA